MNFGANESYAVAAMSDAAYKELDVNMVTVLGYWGHNPDAGALAWRLGTWKQLGYMPIMHPVLYALPPSKRSDGGAQPWPEDTATVSSMSDYNKSMISIVDGVDPRIVVDVVNEPLNNPISGGWKQYFDQWGKAMTGVARFNEYDVLTGVKTDALINGVKGNYAIQRIGLQAHVFVHESKIPPFSFMSGQVRRIHDETGLPIDISECSVSSTEYNNDERAQADLYYRLACWAIDNPHIDSFSLWDMCDRQAWHKGSGILNADGSPKMAFTALQAAFAGRSWSPPPVRTYWWQRWFK